MADTATDTAYGVARGATYQYTVNMVISIIFSLLGAFTILLRGLTLQLRSQPRGNDDVAIFLAFVANVGFIVASYISVRWGAGLRADEIPPSWKIEAIKAIYVIEIFYFLTIFLIKMSLMFLYLRITNGLGTIFYRGTLIMMAVLVGQFVSTVVVEALQCVPMARYWNPAVPGHCINITAFFYATNYFTIITDVIILALPVPTLWKIQRPKRQRVGLLATFLVGALSTLASCVRLHTIHTYTQSTEPVRDAAPINTFSFTEINLGIICASVPAIKPLFTRSPQQSIQSTSASEKQDTVENGPSQDPETTSTSSRNSEESLRAFLAANAIDRAEPRKLRKKPKADSVGQNQSNDIELPPLNFIPTGPLQPFSFASVTHTPNAATTKSMKDGEIMKTTSITIEDQFIST